MADLLTAATASTTSTATSFTAPCTVYVDGDFGGDDGKVFVLMADTEAGEYNRVRTFKNQTLRRSNIEGQGTFWLKAQFVEGSGGSSGISVSTT